MFPIMKSHIIGNNKIIFNVRFRKNGSNNNIYTTIQQLKKNSTWLYSDVLMNLFINKYE